MNEDCSLESWISRNLSMIKKFEKIQSSYNNKTASICNNG